MPPSLSLSPTNLTNLTNQHLTNQPTQRLTNHPYHLPDQNSRHPKHFMRCRLHRLRRGDEPELRSDAPWGKGGKGGKGVSVKAYYSVFIDCFLGGSGILASSFKFQFPYGVGGGAII